MADVGGFTPCFVVNMPGIIKRIGYTSRPCSEGTVYRHDL